MKTEKPLYTKEQFIKIMDHAISQVEERRCRFSYSCVAISYGEEVHGEYDGPSTIAPLRKRYSERYKPEGASNNDSWLVNGSENVAYEALFPDFSDEEAIKTERLRMLNDFKEYGLKEWYS